MWTIGMHSSPYKKIVFVDGCRSAVMSDMASSFGIGVSGNNDQVYIGWRTNITVSGKKETFSPRNFVKYTTKTNPGIIQFWQQMGSGKSVYQSLAATANSAYVPPETMIALWGMNMQMNLGNINGDDNIFIWGSGTSNQLGYGEQ